MSQWWWWGILQVTCHCHSVHGTVLRWFPIAYLQFVVGGQSPYAITHHLPPVRGWWSVTLCHHPSPTSSSWLAVSHPMPSPTKTPLLFSEGKSGSLTTMEWSWPLSAGWQLHCVYHGVIRSLTRDWKILGSNSSHAEHLLCEWASHVISTTPTSLKLSNTIW